MRQRIWCVDKMEALKESAQALGIPTEGKKKAKLTSEITQSRLERERWRQKIRDLYPAEYEGLDGVLPFVPDVRRALPESSTFRGRLGLWNPWKEYDIEQKKLSALVGEQSELTPIRVEDYLESVQGVLQLRNNLRPPYETREFEDFLLTFTETLPLISYLLALDYPLFRVHLVRSDVQGLFKVAVGSQLPISPKDDEERMLLLSISRSAEVLNYFTSGKIERVVSAKQIKDHHYDMHNYQSEAIFLSGRGHLPGFFNWVPGALWTDSRQQWVLRVAETWGYEQVLNLVVPFLQAAPLRKLEEFFQLLADQGWVYSSSSNHIADHIVGIHREEVGAAFAPYVLALSARNQKKLLARVEHEQRNRKLSKGLREGLGRSLESGGLVVATAEAGKVRRLDVPTNYLVDMTDDLTPLVERLKKQPEQLILLGADGVAQLVRRQLLDIRKVNLANCFARIPTAFYRKKSPHIPTMADSTRYLLLLGADPSARVSAGISGSPYIGSDMTQYVQELEGMPVVGVALCKSIAALLLENGASETLSVDLIETALGELWNKLHSIAYYERRGHYRMLTAKDLIRYLDTTKRFVRGDEMYSDGSTPAERLWLEYPRD